MQLLKIVIIIPINTTINIKVGFSIITIFVVESKLFRYSLKIVLN